MQIIIDQEKIDKLLNRGIEDMIVKEHLEFQLKSGKQLRIKFGIDPTAPDIHLGHTVALRKLKQFQDLGHKAVLIIGDFTATIGDPSGKTETRKPLTQEEVKNNLKSYLVQAGKILDIDMAEVRYNSEWLDKFNGVKLLDLLSLVSVQQMLEREDFHKRWLGHQSIRMHEFFYPIMQAYDSVEIKADIEIGGTDQKFNLLAGRDLMEKLGLPPQDVITVPLLEGTDGVRKMSKSYSNYIGVSENPNETFGKIMSIKDELMSKYFLLCTDVSEKEIAEMEKDIKSGELNPRDAKLRLGREIVKIYHGEESAKKAEEEFISVFSKKELPEEMEEVKLKKDKINIVDFLVGCGATKSKGEAKRLVEQGGVRINDVAIEGWDGETEFKGGEVIQVGKRKFLRIVISK